MMLPIPGSRGIGRVIQGLASRALCIAVPQICGMPCPAGAANAELPFSSPSAVPADRWLEVDLYWFDPTAVEHSAQRFWERYFPRSATISLPLHTRQSATINYAETQIDSERLRRLVLTRTWKRSRVTESPSSLC